MRSQHPGIPQPRPRQQQGFSEAQLWQQQLMYKQMQEVRQRQLQQVDLGERQPNFLSHLSDGAKQGGVGKSLPVLSGMPINNAGNFVLPSEIMQGDPKTANNPLMFQSGNTNWAQQGGSSMHAVSSGLMFSHQEGQALRPIGFAPHHDVQSFYGDPISASRYPLNHNYRGSHSVSHDWSQMMNKTVGNTGNKTSMHPNMINYLQNHQFVATDHGRMQEDTSVAKQDIQGKPLFASKVHGNSGSLPGNFQQGNNFSRNAQPQDFQDARDSWSGKSQENEVQHVGPSCSVAGLDSTEEKLLFGPNKHGNFDGPFVDSDNTNKEGYQHGNPIGNSDYFSDFPSIQSGSWSALMLDALDASSSDTGIQEEWSGLSLHKIESSTGEHSTVSNGKKQMTWDENNLQSASRLTTRPFSLFNETSASPSHSLPGFQQSSAKFTYEENERVTPGVSHEFSQQTFKEATNAQLDQRNRQKQFLGNNLQEQTQPNSISDGVWPGQMYGQSVSMRQSADIGLNTQNMQVWDHGQRMPTHKMSTMPTNKSNGWNINQSLGSSADTNPNALGNDDIKGHAQRSTKRTMQLESAQDDIMREVGGNQMAASFSSSDGGQKSDKPDVDSPNIRGSYVTNSTATTDSNALKFHHDMKPHVSHRQDCGEHFSHNFSTNPQGDENLTRNHSQLTRDLQARDLSMLSTDKSIELGENCDYMQQDSQRRNAPNEGYASLESHPSQHTDSEGSARESYLFPGSSPGHLVSGSQKLSTQSGQRSFGPHRFQYHPMGNVEMDVNSVGPQNQLNSQGPYQLASQGLKNMEHDFDVRSQSTGQVFSHSSVPSRKEQLTALQREAKVGNEKFGGTVPTRASNVSPFAGSTTRISHNQRFGQASPNMLELLHKVDQARNNNTPQFNFPDHRALSEIPEAAASDGFSHLQQCKSSALQGFGLKLAPPAQRQSGGDKDSTWVSTTTSMPSLHHPPDASKSGNVDNTYKQESHPEIKGNSLALGASTLPYARDQSVFNQQQQQQQQPYVSTVTQSSPMDQHPKISAGNQVNMDTLGKSSSLPTHAYGSYGGPVSHLSAQATLPSASSKKPPFDLTTSVDSFTSASSQFHSANSGSSQQNSASPHLRSLEQQLPAVGTRSTAHPSVTTGMSRKGFLNNVWTSLSAEQRMSVIQAHRIAPKPPEFMSHFPNSVGTNSRAPQKADDQINSKGGAPSEFGTCSTNSHQLIYGEEYPDGNASQGIPPDRVGGASKISGASQEQELVPRRPPDTTSSGSVSLFGHHQQDPVRSKHPRDSSLDPQKKHAFMPKVDIKKQNYSLLQQMQVMKEVDSDPNKRAGKRLKGAEFSTDATGMECTAGQGFSREQNTSLRELDANSQASSFSSDVNMVSFSREKGDELLNTSSQLMDIDKSSEDLVTAGKHNPQNQSHSKLSTLTFSRGEFPKINPQMARSWFEQYGTYRNGQIVSRCDGNGNSRSTNTIAQLQKFSQVSESRDNSILVPQRDDTAQVGCLQQSMPTMALASNEYASPLHCPPSNVSDNSMVLVPKKRKTATSQLLPWHKEVTQSSRKLQSASRIELDWAQVTNRLVEKVEHENEMIEIVPLVNRPRRRLILTTQLMQQILPSIPAAFLSADATTSYENIVYFISKLVLEDAFSLVSCLTRNSLVHSDSGNMVSENLRTSEKARETFLLKAMEGYIGRSKQMEIDLLRLEKGSLLDARVECHDLERCSIINRFAKFHGRAQSDAAAEGSSASDMASRRIYPQRQVVALPVTGSIPDGVPCLSL